MSVIDGTIATQSELREIYETIPTKYTIYKSGSDVYAKSTTAGGTDYDTTGGSLEATVTQNAFDALTVGRTWKEKVVLKGGPFYINSILSPSDYTVIDAFNAKLVARAGISGLYFIDINGKSNIDILGGFLTGDGSSPTDATTYPEPVYLTTGIKIRNNSSNIHVAHLKTDHLYTAVNVYGGSQHITLDDIYTYKNAADIALVPDTGAISDVNIRNCRSPDGFDDTIALLTETAGYSNISKVNISNCYAAKPSNAGGHAAVKIFANGSGGTITDVNIENNQFSNYLGPTIDLRGPSDSDIDIVGNRLFSPSNHAIYIYNGVTKVRISSNPLIATSTTANSKPIEINTCANAEIDIVDNYIYGYGIGGFGLIDIYDSTYVDILINRIKGLNTAGTRGISLSGTTDYVRMEGNKILDVPYNIIAVGTHVSGDTQPRAVASLDLSAAGTDIVVWHATRNAVLLGYTLLYTEASSADAGVTVEIGRYQDGVALDDDYFDQSTSEQSKNLGYSKTFEQSDLTQNAISAGDTITVGTAGGKAGTGEVLAILNIAFV